MSSRNFLVDQLLSRAEHTMSSITSNDFHRLQAEIQHEEDRRKDLLQQLEDSIPVQFSNIEKYLLFSKVFTQLADSSRYDVPGLRRIYRVSHCLQVDIVGLGSGGSSNNTTDESIYMHAKNNLMGLPIWNNIPFWMDAVFDLCRLDVFVLEKIFTACREHDTAFEDLFLGLSKSQVIVTTIITRTQAVASSMKSLGLSKDIVESFFNAINNKFRLEDYGFEVKENSLSNIAELILNAALDVWMDQGDVVEDNLAAWLRTLQQHIQQDNTGNGGNGNGNNKGMKKTFQYTKYGFAEVLDIHDIGYSMLLTLFYVPALSAVHDWSSNMSNMDTLRRAPTKRSPGPVQRCLCGHEVSPWKLIGRQQPEEIDAVLQAYRHSPADSNVGRYQQHHARLNTLCKHMCESCYRLVFQDPMTAAYDQNILIGRCPVYGGNDHLVTAVHGNLRNTVHVSKDHFVHGRFDEYEKSLSKLYYDLDIQCSTVSTRPSSISTIATLNTYGTSNTMQSSNTAGTSQLSPTRNGGVNSNNRFSLNTNAPSSAGNSTPTAAYTSRPLPPSPSQQQQQQLPPGHHRSSHSNNNVSGNSSSSLYQEDLKLNFPQATSKAHSHHHPSMVHQRSLDDMGDNDDVSVVSGISRMMVDDDGSVARRTQQADIPPLSRSEFNDFFMQLWRGITITLVYSSNPLVEKTRLIFLRSQSNENNDYLIRQVRATKNVAELLQQHVNTATMIPLYLGWAHRSEANALEFSAKKSVLSQNIKNIKVGSKKYKNCLKITTESKTIVLKLEDDEKFQFLLRGLTQFISLVSSCYRG